jgi:hypothetical protein
MHARLPRTSGFGAPVSDTGATRRSWDELVEQAQRDVHRIDAPMGGPYFEKEAADVLAALRLWMDLRGRDAGDWLGEHLTRGLRAPLTTTPNARACRKVARSCTAHTPTRARSTSPTALWNLPAHQRAAQSSI